MKTIKFGEKEYELISIYKHAERLAFSIKKGEDTVDSIADTVDGFEDVIEVYEDGELTNTFKGYSSLLAINLTKNSEFGTYVSVELVYNDIQMQINDILKSIEDLTSSQQAQVEAVNDLAGLVSDLTDTQITQDMAIDDIATTISDMIEE